MTPKTTAAANTGTIAPTTGKISNAAAPSGPTQTQTQSRTQQTQTQTSQSQQTQTQTSQSQQTQTQSAQSPQTQTTAATFHSLREILQQLPYSARPPLLQPTKGSTNSWPTSNEVDCSRCRGYNYCRQFNHPGFRETVTESGLIALEECKCHLEWKAHLRYQKQLEKSHLPTQQQLLTFKELKRLSRGHNRHLEALTALSNSLQSGESLYLWGPSGCGKTTLVCALANELLLRDREVTYTTAVEMLLKLHYSGPESEERLEHYQSTPTLIVEEVGVERATEYSSEQLWAVLEGRRRLGLQTIITSVHPREKEGARYRRIGVPQIGAQLQYIRAIALR